ncbi:PD-(D/E)XK motif protein [Desulfuromonas sp. TF]|uniref:PD-(D/E)XK motif protein n=1 Tax=Desulfuromonas sp. TF TaxID=1232410 RepID=UPI00041A300F|nr:PD-(D/E)XK motif protein [Desulfuromonas sp. TF]
MTGGMQDRLVEIWRDLAVHPEGNLSFTGRRYRRLDLERESGFRLSCLFPAQFWELLVEVPPDGAGGEIQFPQWQGMAFELLFLDVPAKGSKHISLRLDDKDLQDVFVTVCADLAAELQELVGPDQRQKTLADFLDRWSRFFDKQGWLGLSKASQRGLYGELWFLRRLLDSGLPPSHVIGAWKGCERAYHDFEMSGKIVEVKTTLSKEPKRVRISNERQLDDRGLESLHLLVLSLVSSLGGGESLPGIIEELRKRFVYSPGCRRRFNHALGEAGYLEVHAGQYVSTYEVRSVEFFQVKEGFPRILELPSGTGDLSYSLIIAAISAFASDMDEFLKQLAGRA